MVSRFYFKPKHDETALKREYQLRRSYAANRNERVIFEVFERIVPPNQEVRLR